MATFRNRYEYQARFGTPRHDWVCIGARGAIHLHISGPHGFDGRENWSTGLEMHSRTPPEYMQDDAPHDDCWVLKCPCWHDGTSLYAEEFYLPRWMASPHDHGGMFRLLEGEYRERFGLVCAAAPEAK